MITINLLPLEERPKPRRLRLPAPISTLFYALLVAVIAASGFFYLKQSRRVDNLQARLEQISQEERRLAAQTQAIEQLEIRKARLQERLAIMRQLELLRFDNVEWLNTLNEILPGRLWLQTAVRNENGDRSTLEGIATGYRPIAELIEAMEADKHFETVQLVKAERQRAETQTLIQFTVSSTWNKSQGQAMP